MADTRTNPTSATPARHQGGCECGALRFEVEVDLSGPVNRCNCSICTRIGGGSVNVKPEAFRVLSSRDSISEYRKAGSANFRAFCKRCGSQCFGGGYVEELGGHFRAINVHCLDDIDPATLTYQYWDGRHDNWMAGARDKPWPVHA